MAQDWQAFPSAISTGVNTVADTFIEPPESIGTPGDAVATVNNSTNSAFSLLKGMCAELDIAAGSGTGDTNDNGKVYGDPLMTLGETSDAAASGSAAQRFSAISLLKGILAQAGI
jgi:hypothetical protein